MNPASSNRFAPFITGTRFGPTTCRRRGLELQVACLAAFMSVIVEPAAADVYPREILPQVFETQPSHTGGDGIITHTIRSEYQNGENAVHVLVPAALEPGRHFPVLYVLPVYPDSAPARAGLEEVRQRQLHERFGLICVAPAFEQMPWYADHPSNPRDRQESHLLKAVLPFIERSYPARREASGRLLVGFSKSGWGTFSLLLRHPDTFGRAASWDAPFTMAQPGRWGTKRVWPTAADFAPYDVVRLLGDRAPLLRQQPARLAVLGHGLFRDDDIRLHEQMAALGIPHYWDHGPERKHTWESGWLESAVAALASPEMRTKSAKE